LAPHLLHHLGRSAEDLCPLQFDLEQLDRKRDQLRRRPTISRRHRLAG